MITFRKLLGNINIMKEPESQSSLESWFESVLDVPINTLTVEDICRAIRQKICVDQLMPRVLEVLSEDPFAGEFYDGELIAALSTIKGKEIQDNIEVFVEIKNIINKLDTQTLNSDLKLDIMKINQIII